MNRNTGNGYGRRPVNGRSTRPLQKRKKKNSLLANIIKSLLVVIVSLVVILVIFLLIYKPKVDSNPGFDTGTPFDTSENNGKTSGDNSDDSNADAPKVSDGEYKRRENVYNFLLMGKDHVALNTDVIILASFDTKNEKLSILQIPRDTYIEYDGYAHKINYLYGSLHTKAAKNSDNNPEATALAEFSSILEANMCLKIDYYALVDLEGFAKIIDAIGGVTMDIPYDMDYDDPEQDLHIHLKKGENQHLDGDRAEQFVRFRKGFVQGDVGRVEALKIFMSALLRQIKENFSVSTVTKLVQTCFDYLVSTNISAVDAAYFAKELIGVNLSDATMITLPGSDARAEVDSGAWYYILARNDTLNVINSYLNVYEKEITDSIFDRNRVFTSSKEHIDVIYEAEAGTYSTKAYTASDVNENPPDIPLIN